MSRQLAFLFSFAITFALLLFSSGTSASAPTALNSADSPSGSRPQAPSSASIRLSVTPKASVDSLHPLTVTLGATTRVSVASDGTQGDSYSYELSISANGRYVAFASSASNLVSNDTNNMSDVFLHDQQTGQTEQISVASDGRIGNGNSAFPILSADGRYVAFISLANSLVSDDTNGLSDVFVHDRQTGQTTRVSVASDGTQGIWGGDSATLSANGRYVAFFSGSPNLVGGDTNGVGDVFVHDQQTGQTTRISVASDGTQGNNDSGGYSTPAISDDGRYVAFISRATNLVSGDTNGVDDVFVHDQHTGQTTRVSVSSDGTQGNSGDTYYKLAISADGRYVAFHSIASNLVSDDTNGRRDVFVHDQQTGQTTRASVDSNGTQGDGTSSFPTLSGDGRYIAFRSAASNLVIGDTNGWDDIFVHDQQTGQTARVSVSSDGTQGNSESGYSTPSLSSDGRYVAFDSFASNLVSGDTNGTYDVFLHDRGVASACYTLTLSPTISGTVTLLTSPNCSTGVTNLTLNGYTPGSTVSLLAKADTGSTLLGWQGVEANGAGFITLSSIANVTMTGDKTVTATFGKPPRPVVVLVHGWHGVPGAPKTTCSPTAIEYKSDAMVYSAGFEFGVFPHWLTDTYRVFLAQLDTSVWNTPAIERNADCLKAQIDKVIKETQVEKVILIAYSMGGLVSRVYLESSRYDGHVQRLITLGTPHVGTSYAFIPGNIFSIFNLLCLRDTAACQMTPKGMIIFNTLYSIRRENVSYAFIGGTSLTAPRWPLLPLDGENDGVVGVDSARGKIWGWWRKDLVFLLVGDVTGAKLYQVNASHSDGLLDPNDGQYPSYFVLNKDWKNHLDQTTPALQCVQAILSNTQCSGASVPLTARTISPTAVAQLPWQTGHLTTGQVVTHVLQVDTNGLSQFTLTWLTGTTGLTLINPAGAVIDPTYATAHPSVVIYQVNLTNTTSPLTAQYLFSVTVPGLYTATLTAGEVGPEGTDFWLSAQVESPRTLAVGTNDLIYTSSGVATLTATLQNADVGLAGATVQAHISRSGLITDTVTLTDRGGGIYTGTYPIPNAPGYLGLSVIAQGDDAGTPYVRQTDNVLTVAPLTAQLRGEYTDNAVDADGNGKYESLNVTLGVTTTQAGSYLVSGDLSVSNTVVAHSAISVTWGAGVFTTTLRFNGDEIRRSGLSGLYTLTNLTVADQQNSGVPAVWRAMNLWTTAAYNAADFAASCYVLTANVSSLGAISANPFPDCNSALQYTSGTIVTLTATANPGATFTGWEGDVITNTSLVLITLDVDRTLTANFVANNRLYLPLLRK